MKIHYSITRGSDEQMRWEGYSAPIALVAMLRRRARALEIAASITADQRKAIDHVAMYFSRNAVLYPPEDSTLERHCTVLESLGLAIYGRHAADACGYKMDTDLIHAILEELRTTGTP